MAIRKLITFLRYLYTASRSTFPNKEEQRMMDMYFGKNRQNTIKANTTEHPTNHFISKTSTTHEKPKDAKPSK